MMSGDQESSAAEAVQRQVRVQLTTQQEDIALPESTGPILVPTGEISHILSLEAVVISRDSNGDLR
jgi:ribosome biogenesis protein YTM1